MTIADVYRERCAEDSDIAAHLPYLYEAVVQRDAKIVVELGVRYGNSTSALLAGVHETGGHLWSVDPQPMPPAEWLTNERWSLLPDDDLSAAALGFIPDTIGVLFIDTSHMYAHTLMELNLYGPRVRSGGVILLHDTEFEMAGEEGYPVARALDDWCPTVGLSWTNRTGSYGLGVVEIP